MWEQLIRSIINGNQSDDNNTCYLWHRRTPENTAWSAYSCSLEKENMGILHQTMTHASGNGCQRSRLGSCTCMEQCRYLHSDRGRYTELFSRRMGHLPCTSLNICVCDAVATFRYLLNSCEILNRMSTLKFPEITNYSHKIINYLIVGNDK